MVKEVAWTVVGAVPAIAAGIWALGLDTRGGGVSTDLGGVLALALGVSAAVLLWRMQRVQKLQWRLIPAGALVLLLIITWYLNWTTSSATYLTDVTAVHAPLPED